MTTTTHDIDPFAGLATAAPTSSPQVQLLTAKQETFLNNLLAERPMFRDVENLWPENVAKLTKNQASKKIDEVLQVRKEAPASKKPVVDLPQGVYAKDGVFYRVYLTRETKQKVVGKLVVRYAGLRDDHGDLIRDEHGYAVQPAEADWEYLGKRGLSLLTIEDKCSHEEASKFGAMYGICCACTAHLNDPVSVYHGYGPVCAGHNHWPRLTPGQLAKVYENRGVTL